MNRRIGLFLAGGVVALAAGGGAVAPFVATLVDVTGLIIYFIVAVLILAGTVL